MGKGGVRVKVASGREGVRRGFSLCGMLVPCLQFADSWGDRWGQRE